MTTNDNPAGLDGFDFLEFGCKNAADFEEKFQHLGFTKTKQHPTKPISVFQQNEIKFIVNSDPESLAYRFSEEHVPGASHMGFRVADGKAAFERAISKGAKPFADGPTEETYGCYAIYGIGGGLIIFVDKYGDKGSVFDEFKPLVDSNVDLTGCGLYEIDHLTHNMIRGNMEPMYEFYHNIFNFREIRFFDIKGKHTGLISKALTSPCEKIKIPLNEGTEEGSQIEEFLTRFNGEGIQHIALSTNNIFDSVHQMREAKINFLDTPDTYYELLDKRVPQHGEAVEALKKEKILLDGSVLEKKGTLLQIFTEDMFGPQFFEIIQRKGNEGFGEGNFQALFESIELDQIRRGVLSE